MPTVSSIDGFRCYRNHHTTGHLRLCLSVSSRKRRQTLKRINVAGERRQWTSVKAIYVNAETRILIYILCGTEICDYNPRRRRCIGQRASRPPPFPLLFPRDEIYIYIYIMPVPRLRFEERETGPKRWLSRAFRGKHWIYRVFDIPESINAAPSSSSERPTSLTTSRRDRFLHPWLRGYVSGMNRSFFNHRANGRLFANRTEETNV